MFLNPFIRAAGFVGLVSLGAVSAQAQFSTVINVPGDDISSLTGIGSDTQLNLFSGGTIVSSLFTPFDAGLFQGDDPGNPTSSNVEVNVFGGDVGAFFQANTGSTINISGGTIDEVFSANGGSTVNISGGAVGPSFLANGGSTVNLSGGTVGDGFVAALGSTVNLLGSAFAIDGSDITGTLTPGTPTTITTRGGAELTGTLADGSAFSFDLNAEFSEEDFFSADALVTVALQVSSLEGDYNDDGFVSQSDLDLVLLNWGDNAAPIGFNENALPGGGPFDGQISQNELDGVLLNWGDGTPPTVAIPEPATLTILAATLAMSRRRAGLRTSSRGVVDHASPA